MKPPILSEIEAILKVSGIASASLLSEEAKGRVCHSVAIDIAAYYEPLIEQAKADLAREIFEILQSRLIKTPNYLELRYEDWQILQSFQSKYTGGKK